MKMGLVIGAIGALIGVAAAFYAAGPFMGLVVLVIIGVSLLPFMSVFKNIANRDKLLKTGARGVAKVLEMRDTGVTINNSPQVGLTLEVTPQDGPPFTTETRVIVNRLQVHMYQPGMQLNVRFDPNDRTQVAVESIAGGGMGGMQVGGMQMPGIAPAMNQSDAMQLVQSAQAQAERLNQVGRPATAIITAFNPLGINVNGNNPAATLLVKVMPSDAPPFDSKITGVFASTGLHKYQPGKEVFVKYDPIDTSTVAIDYQKAQVQQT